MARKAGQLISRGPRTWLVRISLGRDPEIRTPGTPHKPTSSTKDSQNSSGVDDGKTRVKLLSLTAKGGEIVSAHSTNSGAHDSGTDASAIP